MAQIAPKVVTGFWGFGATCEACYALGILVPASMASLTVPLVWLASITMLSTGGSCRPSSVAGEGGSMIRGGVKVQGSIALQLDHHVWCLIPPAVSTILLLILLLYAIY